MLNNMESFGWPKYFSSVRLGEEFSLLHMFALQIILGLACWACANAHGVIGYNNSEKARESLAQMQGTLLLGTQLNARTDDVSISAPESWMSLYYPDSPEGFCVRFVDSAVCVGTVPAVAIGFTIASQRVVFEYDTPRDKRFPAEMLEPIFELAGMGPWSRAPWPPFPELDPLLSYQAINTFTLYGLHKRFKERGYCRLHNLGAGHVEPCEHGNLCWPPGEQWFEQIWDDGDIWARPCSRVDRMFNRDDSELVARFSYHIRHEDVDSTPSPARSFDWGRPENVPKSPIPPTVAYLAGYHCDPACVHYMRYDDSHSPIMRHIMGLKPGICALHWNHSEPCSMGDLCQPPAASSAFPSDRTWPDFDHWARPCSRTTVPFNRSDEALVQKFSYKMRHEVVDHDFVSPARAYNWNDELDDAHDSL